MIPFSSSITLSNNFYLILLNVFYCFLPEPKLLSFRNNELSLLPHILLFYCRESISLVDNDVSLPTLSFFFVLDCLSLYFSDPNSFESFKALFPPDELFQFNSMRVYLLFFLCCVMLITRLTSLCRGSEGSGTFSLSHSCFVPVCVVPLLFNFLVACSPALFWCILFSYINFLGGFSSSYFSCDNI